MASEFKPFAFLQAVRDKQELSPSAKAVAVVCLLSRRNHMTGLCNPGIECIKADTGYQDKRTIYRAIDELVAHGVISVRRELGKSNDYVLMAGQDEPVTLNALGASNVGASNVPSTSDVGALNVPGTSNVGASNATRPVTLNDTGVGALNVPLRREERKEEEIRKETKKTTEQTDTSDVAIAPVSDSVSLKAKKEKAEAKATRFDLEELPFEWFLDAFEIQRELDAYKLFDGFADYWANVPGAKGKKIDWKRTWRNYLRDFPDWKRDNYMREGRPMFNGEPYRVPIDPNGSVAAYKAMEEAARQNAHKEDDLIAFAESRVNYLRHE